MSKKAISYYDLTDIQRCLLVRDLVAEMGKRWDVAPMDRALKKMENKIYQSINLEEILPNEQS